MCKVYTGYCDTSEIEHGLCACTVDNLLAKAWGLSLRTGAKPCSISHLIPVFSISGKYPELSVTSILSDTVFTVSKFI